MDIIELSRTVKIANTPPTDADIPALRKAGIKTLIDLRPAGTAAHAHPASALDLHPAGLGFVRVPLHSDRLDSAALGSVGEALEQADKPALVFGHGARAGAFALPHVAVEAGLPGQDMLEMAHALGIPIRSEEEKHVLATYVDGHERRADPMERRHRVLAVGGTPSPLLTEGVKTVRDEIAEDHHRQFAAESGQRAVRYVRATAHTSGTIPPAPAASATISASPAGSFEAVSNPPGYTFAALTAVAGLVLMALDRRFALPLLLISGALMGSMAARAAGRLAPPPPPVTDQEVRELERRLHRLEKVA